MRKPQNTWIFSVVLSLDEISSPGHDAKGTVRGYFYFRAGIIFRKLGGGIMNANQKIEPGEMNVVESWSLLFQLCVQQWTQSWCYPINHTQIPEPFAAVTSLCAQTLHKPLDILCCVNDILLLSKITSDCSFSAQYPSPTDVFWQMSSCISEIPPKKQQDTCRKWIKALEQKKK